VAAVITLAVTSIAFMPVWPASADNPVRAARNVILLIGDGMGSAQVETCRRAAALAGRRLAMDSMPVTSLVITTSAGGEITDSAAAATAMATGRKTVNGRLGIGPDGEYLPNITESVRATGGLIGLVTNCSITSATPAGFVVHIPDRDSGRDIARAMVEAGPDVALGGGAAFFMPTLFERARPALDSALEKGYTVVMELDELEAAFTLPLLGLFAMTDMPYELDRDLAEEPSLRQMTQKALALLAKSSGDAGFFLMVEGGRIDHACHAMDSNRLIAEVASLDDAVSAALEFARRRGDTLVVVTADHETGQLEVTNDGRIVFGHDGHTEALVPLFAEGPGQEWFSIGVLDNTDIARLIARALCPPGAVSGRGPATRDRPGRRPSTPGDRMPSPHRRSSSPCEHRFRLRT
jgi:alkaline phosphatase